LWRIKTPNVVTRNIRREVHRIETDRHLA